MGFLSGVKKAANVAFNPSTWVSTAKDFLGSDMGGMAAEAAGMYFGYPGAGTMLSKMAGGDWGGAASSAMDMYKQYSTSQSTDRQYKQAWDQQLSLLAMQDASARGLAEHSNEMNVRNAQRQYDWQKGLSDTAHQREVYDLREAGLNPILSGTGGMGASTPSSSVAPAVTAPVADRGRVASSAADIVRTLADTSKINAAKDLLNAQTLTEARRPLNVEMDTNLKRTQDATTATLQTLHKANRQKVLQETTNLEEVLNNIKATGKQTAAHTAQIQQATANLKQVFKGLKMRGDIDASEYGRLMEMAKRATDVAGVSELVNAFKGLKAAKK